MCGAMPVAALHAAQWAHRHISPSIEHTRGNYCCTHNKLGHRGQHHKEIGMHLLPDSQVPASRTRLANLEGGGGSMGLGGFGGAGPEAPPNVTEGAGQAPPPTRCAPFFIYPCPGESAFDPWLPPPKPVWSRGYRLGR
jgi:hypothetical protein